eukprot:11228284-Lingulodinium_polyedra.AAC.3
MIAPLRANPEWLGVSPLSSEAMRSKVSNGRLTTQSSFSETIFFSVGKHLGTRSSLSSSRSTGSATCADTLQTIQYHRISSESSSRPEPKEAASDNASAALPDRHPPAVSELLELQQVDEDTRNDLEQPRIPRLTAAQEEFAALPLWVQFTEDLGCLKGTAQHTPEPENSCLIMWLLVEDNVVDQELWEIPVQVLEAVPDATD